MPKRASREPPIQPLTVFLMKSGSKRFEDGLKDPAAVTRFGLRRTVPFAGALFVAPQRRASPRWLDFVRDGTATNLDALFNASVSAVLFVKASRRTFVFSFGYGRALLHPARVERSFGLRVVLNTVDPAALRNVDSNNIQELTVHTRRQTSRGSRLADFAIDTEEDLVRAMTGAPQDPTFARMVSGSDALLFRAPVTFTDLGAKCRELLQAYRSQKYKDQGFEFVDHVREVNDPTLITELDEELVDALRTESLGELHLAPPEIIDWENIDGFCFSRGAAPEPDLRIESLLEQIRKPQDLSVERLKRQRVYVHIASAAEPVSSWPVYNTLVGEIHRGTRRFVLSAGDWYQVDATFVERVRRRVGQLKAANLGLPEARRGEHEKEYNKRAAEKRGVYLADRKCLRENGDPIELCDLYTSKREIVHVKWWKASATLSHLFAQGLVSAETLVSDARFRDQARELLGRQASSLRSHFSTKRPDASAFTIVFAIIAEVRRGWRKSLPFFSQLRLARTAEDLRRLGFEVRVEHVGVESER